MTTESVHEGQNPPGHVVDLALLQTFEQGLNARFPDRSRIPCRILGYGEISTVLEIQMQEFAGLAFKRLALFRSTEEVERYRETYVKYNRLLQDEAGVRLPSNGYAILSGAGRRPIFYIIQEKLPSAWIGNHVLRALASDGSQALVRRILGELGKVWTFNRDHPNLQLAIDGQLSNWALAGFDGAQPGLSADARLYYLDTSTPLMKIERVEQLESELFLRNAPAPMAALIRAFFLKNLLERYYDARQVALDLLANFYKEQRPELIPALIPVANSFLQTQPRPAKPLTEREVQAYYKEDAFIWTFYMAARRLDRGIQTRLLRRDYPYILPGRVKR